MATQATKKINDGTVRMLLDDVYGFERTNVLIEPLLAGSVEYLTPEEFEQCKREWASGRLYQALESKANLKGCVDTLNHRYYNALLKGVRKMRARTVSYVNPPENKEE